MDIRSSSEAVWDLIRPAETAVVLQEDVVRGFQVPGTPSGVGERQCFITLENRLEVVSMIEVLEETQGQRAVARLINAEDPQQRTTYEVAGSGGLTRLRVTYASTVPVGPTIVGTTYEDHYRAHARAYLDRVKRLIEAGWPTLVPEAQPK